MAKRRAISNPELGRRSNERDKTFQSQPSLEEKSSNNGLENEDCLDKKIQTLFEFYLGEANLSKDVFLLKHIQRHPDAHGFISLKLLSKYKKIKQFNKDVADLKQILKDSDILELNEDGTKIRPRRPLSEGLLRFALPFKAIIVYNFQKGDFNFYKLATIFKQFGEINSLQMHHPDGKKLQQIQMLEKEDYVLTYSLSAIIQYENVISAYNAFDFVENSNLSMKVMQLHEKHLRHLDAHLGYGFDNWDSHRNSNSNSCPCERSLMNLKSATMKAPTTEIQQLLYKKFSKDFDKKYQSSYKSHFHADLNKFGSSSNPNSPRIERRTAPSAPNVESCPNSPLPRKKFTTTVMKRNVIRQPFGPSSNGKGFALK